MTTMERYNTTQMNTENKGYMMEKPNGLLDRVINVLGRKGCIEGSYTDIYLQRFIYQYIRHKNKVFEGHYEGETIRDITTTELRTVKSGEQNKGEI